MKKQNCMIFLAALVCAQLLTGCGGEKNTNEVSDTETAENETAEMPKFQADDYVTLGDYKEINAEYQAPVVTDEEVEEYIAEVLDENTEYNEITNRPTKEGDSVNIDYIGKIDGKEFDGGSDTEYDLLLGSGEFLEEFETSLLGKNTGETVVFDVTFPEDYYEELAGKTAEFTVEINSVSEAVVPEYNDAFVAETTEYKTTEEYEQSIREELMQTATEEAENAAGEDALAQVIEAAEINGYPQELYDVCEAETMKSYQSFADMLGITIEEFEAEYLSEGELEEATESWVNEILVTTAIAEKEGFAVTDKTFQKEAENMAEKYEYASVEELLADYGKMPLQASLLHDKTVQFLYKSFCAKQESMIQ